MKKIFKPFKNKTVRTILLEIILRIITVAAIIVLTVQLISQPIKQFLIAISLIIIYTILESIVFRKFFKHESEVYLGWRLLWLYPSNQIMIAVSVLTICLIGLIVGLKWSDDLSNESIIIGVTTGIIASSVIIIFTELSNNYKNNLKRLAVLNDYFNVVHFYNDDIELNKKRIKNKLKTGDIQQLIQLDKVIETIKETGESYNLFADYSELELQAIAWEIIEYGELLQNTIEHYADLLYLNEIKSLNNINSCIKSIRTRITTSQKIADAKALIKQLKENPGTTVDSKTNDPSKNLSYESYLYDISQEKDVMVLSGIVTLLVYFDQNMKLLKQYVLYIDDKELRHFKHLARKVDRDLSQTIIDGIEDE